MRANTRSQVLAGRALQILALCILAAGGLLSLKALVYLEDIRLGLAVVIPGFVLLLWGGILAEVK
jgi:hypothetical protein